MSIINWAKSALERNTSELAEIDQCDLHMGWGGRCYFPTQLIHARIRPALGVLRLNVQESVLSEAEARRAQNLKLRFDERSLGFVQRLTLCSRRRFRADREHSRCPRFPQALFGSQEYTVTSVQKRYDGLFQACSSDERPAPSFTQAFALKLYW